MEENTRRFSFNEDQKKSAFRTVRSLVSCTYNLKLDMYNINEPVETREIDFSISAGKNEHHLNIKLNHLYFTLMHTLTIQTKEDAEWYYCGIGYKNIFQRTCYFKIDSPIDFEEIRSIFSYIQFQQNKMKDNAAEKIKDKKTSFLQYVKSLIQKPIPVEKSVENETNLQQDICDTEVKKEICDKLDLLSKQPFNKNYMPELLKIIDCLALRSR